MHFYQVTVLLIVIIASFVAAAPINSSISALSSIAQSTGVAPKANDGVQQAVVFDTLASLLHYENPHAVTPFLEKTKERSVILNSTTFSGLRNLSRKQQLTMLDLLRRFIPTDGPERRVDNDINKLHRRTARRYVFIFVHIVLRVFIYA